MSTWTELLDRDKCFIVKEHTNGASIYELANKYTLNPDSLGRKIRLLKQNGEIDRYLNGLKDQEGDLIRPVFQDNAVTIQRVDSENPDDRTAIIRPQQETWRILLYTDTHFPYQDQPACDAFVRCAAFIPHDFIVCGGDNLDFYGLSAYGKDVNMLFENSLQREVIEHEKFLISLASVSTARKISLFGNHMQRYIRWLDNNSYIRNTEAYRPENLLKLKDYGWYPFVGRIMFNAQDDPYYPNPQFIIEHGTTARKNAGVTVQKQSENWGFTSIAMGHVHRLSVNYKRTLRGQVVTAECGTLRDLNPEYVSFPDWTHGAMYITVSETEVIAQPIFINKGIAHFGNQEI